MVGRKKKPKFCEKRLQEDLISQLPDALICEILCHLSTKVAVRTSVLSTRWRNLWQCVPGLYLDSWNFMDVNGFVSFVDKFCGSQKESWIRNVRLHVSDFRRESLRLNKPQLSIPDDVPIESYLSSRIDAFTRRMIQHLDVGYINYPNCSTFYIPLSLYTCETLVSLKLQRAALVNAEFVSLPCLKIMRLEMVSLPNKATWEKLISGTPVLEDLAILRCFCFKMAKVLQVCSRTLKRLDISKSCGQYVIDAPLLQCLRTDPGFRKNFKIINSGFPAKLDIGVVSGFGLTQNKTCEILADISRVRELVICGFLFKCMYQQLKFGPSLPKFRYLSHLNATFTKFYLNMLPPLLENCPILESLKLNLVQESCKFVRYSEEPKVEFSTVLPQCLVSSLKFVELRSSISKYEIEMEIVRFFLKNSTILEKLRLDTYNYSGKEKHAILDELLAMPRCSSACEVLLLYETLPKLKFMHSTLSFCS